jgi:hypothetical protein
MMLLAMMQLVLMWALMLAKANFYGLMLLVLVLANGDYESLIFGVAGGLLPDFARLAAGKGW